MYGSKKFTAEERARILAPSDDPDDQDIALFTDPVVREEVAAILRKGFARAKAANERSDDC